MFETCLDGSYKIVYDTFNSKMIEFTENLLYKKHIKFFFQTEVHVLW